MKMKTVNKIKEKKHKTIRKLDVKSKKEKVLIVAQEIKFARLLAGNEKKTRDRVLKTFKKWLLNRFDKGYEFREDDFIRVWKGLFYAVWMSDKPLVQEELCETIAGILDLFPPDQLHSALMMTKAGFKVLATEWYGIDHHRLDKFYMLVRRYLRGSLRCLRRSEWGLRSCEMYAQMLAGTDGLLALKTPMYARNAGSMLMHVVDCFLEELAKVSEGALPEACVPVLLRPFCAYVCGGAAPALCAAARRLLTALLRQTDEGIRYQHKTKAWEMMGCPAGGPDALELVSDDEDSPGEDYEDDDMDDRPRALDPRAGRVDVVLPHLPAAASAMASLLKELLATASSKAYKRTKICMDRFSQLAAASYPLVVRVEDEEATAPPIRAIDAARELSALETSLVRSADELALRGLSRRHRKRLLAKARTGASIVDDVTASPKPGIPPVPKNKSEKVSKPTHRNEKRKRHHKDNAAASTEKNVKRQKVSPQQSSPSENVPTKSNKQTGSTTSSESLLKKSNKQTGSPTSSKSLLTKTNKQTTSTKDAKRRQQRVEHHRQDRKTPSLPVSKVKNYQKKTTTEKQSPQKKASYETPKKVKFALKNNSMQQPVDYYKSVRQSPNIPFDSSKQPSKTNLKVSTPSPINPFLRKKLRLK